MHKAKGIRRVPVAVAAAAALGTLGMTGASAPGAAAHTGQPAGGFAKVSSRVLATPGAQLWVKRYNGPGRGYDSASSVAVSPGGGRVFVTGHSTGATSGYDYATAAYNAATGARLWLARYNGSGTIDDNGDAAYSMAVSPDGSKVFVTGASAGIRNTGDYATVAYSAATGARLWVKRYNGPGPVKTGYNFNEANSVAVSPDSSTVFVTGTSRGTTTEDDYATIAYNAATGAQKWLKRYTSSGSLDDYATSVAVSPDGSTVFVTGSSVGYSSGYDYTTIAYNAATGAQRWLKRYNGPANGYDHGYSVTVSPDGGTVFVTGQSEGTDTYFDYATVAYDAATGAQRWAQRYDGPANGYEHANSVAVSPDGSTVFVTGESEGIATGADYATVAYDAATGAQQWAQRYNGPGNRDDTAYSVAVSPDGDTVVVTGDSWGTDATGYDYATIAYDTATGARQWAQSYNGPANGDDSAYSVAVSPTNGTVFITGASFGTATGMGYATIAYSS